MVTRRIYGFILAVCAGLIASAEAPKGYYLQGEGLSGENLLVALHNIIKDHKQVSYTGLWDLYATTDADEDGLIIDIYTTKHWEKGSEQCGTGKAHIGSCYTREHSFPKSWFGGAVYPMYSDAFHIYPADFYVNNQRNNNPYGECANGVRKDDYDGYHALGKLGTSTFEGYTGKVFEPDDEYKGDLARGYFYMATRYYDVIAGWVGCDMLTPGSQFPAFSPWALQLLLKWNRLDPVSQKEIDRNEAIYKVQGNRNPFIDNPELAEYIWGTNVNLPWSTTLVTPPAFSQPIYGTVVDCGVVKVGDSTTTPLNVSGTNFTEDIVFSLDVRDFDDPTTEVPDEPIDEEESKNYSFVWTNPAELNPAKSFGDDDTSVDVKDVIFINGPITITSKKGTATTAPRLYKSNNLITLRTYAGNSTTISSQAGNIVKVEFGSSMKSFVGAVQLGYAEGEEYSDAKGALSEDGKTWTGNTGELNITWAKVGSSTPLITYITVYVETKYQFGIDNLEPNLFGIPTATGKYAKFTATETTGRNYEVFAYGKQSYFQLKLGDTASPSGIVTTSTSSEEGSLRAVRVTWNDKTTAGRTLNIYGKNEPYTGTADLYNTSTAGTLIGSITYDGEETTGSIFMHNESYKYIGIKSKSGALYVDNIEVAWDEDEPFLGHKNLAAWVKAAPAEAEAVIAPATVIYTDGDKHMYMTDGRTAVHVYDASSTVPARYTPGDVIPGGYKGAYFEYAGSVEFYPDVTSFAAASAHVAVPKARLFEIADLSSQADNQYVYFNNVTITKNGEGNNYTATDRLGNIIIVYNRFGINIPTGRDMMVSGFISIYNDDFEIIPISIEKLQDRVFTIEHKSLAADEVNNATALTNIFFTPTSTGTFTAALMMQANGTSTQVLLTGTAVSSLTTIDATEITPESFIAQWVDLDPESDEEYQLYVFKEGSTTPLPGYPVDVISTHLQHSVTGLDDETTYYYYVTCNGETSNTTYVTTLDLIPEINVAAAIEGDLVMTCAKDNVSKAETINVHAYHLSGNLEVSVEAPFEVSEDMLNWSHTINIDSQIDHFYIRLNAKGLAVGNYGKVVYVKGGRYEMSEEEAMALMNSARRRVPAWSVINDNLVAYGNVLYIESGLTDVRPDTPWEAYSQNGALIIDNRGNAPIKVNVYTIDGNEVTSMKAASGITRSDLSAGFYLIVSGDEARRVMVK